MAMTSAISPDHGPKRPRVSCLRALVALLIGLPSPLWANPSGTYQTHCAAREAYRFLGAEDRIGIWYREGGHDHGLVDWRAFLDYADLRFRGTPTATRFDENPFPEVPLAYSWAAPAPGPS